MKVPFAKPHFPEPDIEEILNKIREVIKSGWLTSGRYVEELESQFADVVGSTDAVALNSCTASLHAILLGLDIGLGDEVIVPDNTFVATANSVWYTGARPVLADSHPETYNLSPKDVEKKISPRTKAIIPVHLAGNPCDMKELTEIAEDHHLLLVEDCAHAHGAEYRGKRCGTLGSAAAFSFYATKIITAGEGGMVTTNDAGLAEKIRKIRNHGRGGFGPVEITDLGYNYRMPNIQAIIALSQLSHLHDFVEQRRAVARSYNSIINKIPWLQRQFVRAENLCSYYVYLAKLTEGAPINRDELVEELGRRGVSTSILYHPIHGQPLYSKMDSENDSYPVADELGRTSFALPMFNGMTDEQLDYVGLQVEDIAGLGREQYANIKHVQQESF